MSNSSVDPAWARTEAYHEKLLVKADPALDFTLRSCMLHSMPRINVPASQGKLMMFFVRSLGARRVLEVGTLGGYASIWLARGLPEGGKLTTLELEEKFAIVARENIENAGLTDKVDVVIGPASETLKSLTVPGSFDLAFIDADKPGYLTYFKHARRLVRKGGAIIVDNTTWNGEVSDPSIQDEDVNGIREVLEYISHDTGVESTAISMAGAKGYEGFTYCMVL